MRSGGWAAVSLVLAVLVAGCSRESSESGPPQAEEVLAAAAQAMGAVESVRFTLEREGAPVFIDDQGLLAFVAAEGRFVAPGTADALVTVTAAGLTTQIGAVVVEGQTWLTNPLTGRWERAPAGYVFDPATLFDPAVGWRPLLAAGLSEVDLVDDRAGEEGTLYHLRATAAGDRVAVMTAGLAGGDPVRLDLWIDPDRDEVRRVEFSTAADGGVADWRLSLADYGADFEITPPDLDGGG